MRCPFCATDADRVVDTRPSDGGEAIRRRRECTSCQRRFTTYETIELEMPLIVKKDGRREPYDRAKLISGFRKACEKRPVSIEAQERAIAEIERGLQEQPEREVPSTRLGDRVLAALRGLDDVAYLRFASVYLAFKDLAELMNEVQRMMPPGAGREAQGPSTTPPARPDATAADPAPGPDADAARRD